MSIKSFLQSRLPATRSFVYRRFDEVSHELFLIEKMQDEITKVINEKISTQNISIEENNSRVKELKKILLEGVNNSNKGIKELKRTLQENANSNSKRVNELSEKIQKNADRNIKEISNLGWRSGDKAIFWHNAFEKKIVSENWGDVCEKKEFTEKYLKLINGLDEQSVESIQKTLSRQHQYLNSDTEEKDLFTQKEQKQLRELKDNFYNRIFKINDELYAYKNYLLPINHFEASVFYYKHGLDEIILPLSMKNKTIVDVGGFVGDSILIMNEFPHKNIISFEADPVNFELMQRTINLNKIENVLCENMALGAKEDTMTMHRKGAMSTLISRQGIEFESDIEVKQTTLDNYVENHNIDCGLIKVDIEGGEPYFLEGARNTIEAQHPILLISIYHNAHDFFEIKPMIESWNLGYKFSIYKPTDGSATGETLLIAKKD